MYSFTHTFEDGTEVIYRDRNPAFMTMELRVEVCEDQQENRRRFIKEADRVMRLMFGDPGSDRDYFVELHAELTAPIAVCPEA